MVKPGGNTACLCPVCISLLDEFARKALILSNPLKHALLWLAVASQPTFASAGSLALTLAAWRCNIASLSTYCDLGTYVTSPYMRASRW